MNVYKNLHYEFTSIRLNSDLNIRIRRVKKLELQCIPADVRAVGVPGIKFTVTIT